MTRLAAPLALTLLLAFATRAAEVPVASAADIARVAATAAPGDVLIMKDGAWTDQKIAFTAKGAADKPITLRAQTPGKVILSGNSSLIVDGEYLVVSGLFVKDGKGTTDGVRINGSHCRLTDSTVIDSTYKFYIHLAGSDNRFDHCYLAGKTSESPTLQVEAEGKPNHHQIDHNHFGPRPPLGKNGGETMRVGYSQQSMNSSATLVEENLFDRCDGEIEIISSKSCDNVYRFNTFLDCAGMLTLRHGNRCLVEGNIFLGHHKKGSGGIRVIGEDHFLINNYIDGVDKGGFWITAGVPDSPLNGYFCARRATIAFNTVVDSKGPCLELDAGFGGSNRSLRPENITIANNIFSPGEGGTLLKGTEGEGFKWLGNLSTAPVEHVGIKVLDPKLEKAKDGLLRPSGQSPAHAAAEGEFPNVKTDIDGQPRPARPDVGCDQISDAPVTHRPLTAADVGPSWMDRSALTAEGPGTKR
jgi:poly(beta-D-mannuronate) lyase